MSTTNPSDHFSAEFRTVWAHIGGAEQTEFAERMQRHLKQAGWQLLGSWEDETSLLLADSLGAEPAQHWRSR